jgi:hypothetical protein
MIDIKSLRIENALLKNLNPDDILMQKNKDNSYENQRIFIMKKVYLFNYFIF